MYGIICSARRKRDQGVSILALVDRRFTRTEWWTADNPGIAMMFASEREATRMVDKLSLNDVKVCTFDRIREKLNRQRRKLAEARAATAADASDDPSP